MKNKSVRLAVASVVAVLSVLGLSKAPPTPRSSHHHVGTGTDGWCC